MADDPTRDAWIERQYVREDGVRVTRLRPAPRTEEPEQHITGRGQRLIRMGPRTIALRATHDRQPDND